MLRSPGPHWLVPRASRNSRKYWMGRQIAGYSMVAMPMHQSGAFTRYLYVKKHTAKSDENGETKLAADRTAYVVNLPLHPTAASVKALLETAGPIQTVVMGKESSPSLVASNAHVVFKAKSGLQKLLKMSSLPMASEPMLENVMDTIKAQYLAERPGLDVLKSRADEFMSKFDAEEEVERREREGRKNAVDKDGFKIIVNTKRKHQEAEALLPFRKKNQKNKELLDFYRFQLREKKRGQLKTLRERFDEDREIVERLKRSNRFKPEVGFD